MYFQSTGSVPVSLQLMAPLPHAYFQLYMLSTKRNKYFTSQNRKLPVITIIIRYIEAHKYLRTCFPTYFCVAILVQPSPCLIFNSFPSFYAHKVYMYRNHQQKCNLINFGPSQLFFELIIFSPCFRTSLTYINIFLRKYKHPLVLHALQCK